MINPVAYFLFILPIVFLLAGSIACKRVDPTQMSESEMKAIGDGMDLNLEASIEEVSHQIEDYNYLDIIPDSNPQSLSDDSNGGTSSKITDKKLNPDHATLQLTSSADKRKNELDRAKKFVGDLKKSLASLGKSTCKIIKPYFSGPQNTLMHPYFFTGFEANAGAGVIGLMGKDFVWDLYNMQFSAFNYKGFGFTAGSSSIGAEVSGYFGIGFGQKPDIISAWSGKFQSTGISGSLPILADYLSLGASGFTGLSSLGKADYSIFGASVNGSLSFSVPTVIPVSGSVKQAEWTHSKNDNLSAAAVMRKSGIKLATSGRETCNEQCVRFDSGDAKASYRSRSQMLIRSIPVLANIRGLANYFPEFNKVALLALATGVYRDTANAAEVCKRRN